MSASEKNTLVLQLLLQLLIVALELLMLQEEFMIQLGPSIGAFLKRDNVSVIIKIHAE